MLGCGGTWKRCGGTIEDLTILVNWDAAFNLSTMDIFSNPAEIMSFSSALLLLLLTANRALDLLALLETEEDFDN
jgi:hypothetical protein